MTTDDTSMEDQLNQNLQQLGEEIKNIRSPKIIQLTPDGPQTTPKVNSWSEADALAVLQEASIKRNDELRTTWLGREIRPRTYIIDIVSIRNGDVYVLCFIPYNAYHKFVTWGFNPDTADTFWGEYIANLNAAVINLAERTMPK